MRTMANIDAPMAPVTAITLFIRQYMRINTTINVPGCITNIPILRAPAANTPERATYRRA